MPQEELVYLADVEVKGFNNSTLRAGKTGSGKTNSGEFECENWYLFGNRKIIDFDISNRFENCSYSLPEDNPELTSLYENFPAMVDRWKLEPMGFQDEVLLFCGRNLESFPDLPKNFKVVSFQMKDITIDILRDILGATESLGHFLNSFQLKFGDDVTMQDLWTVLFEERFRGKPAFVSNTDQKQLNMIKIRIQSWQKTGLFADAEEYGVEKIDFLKVFLDQKTITCFNSSLLAGSDEEHLAYALVLHKLLELMRKRHIPHRVLCYVREIHFYLEFPSCLKYFNVILRTGRTLGKAGIDLLVDTQRPIDLKPYLRRQFTFNLQHQGDLNDAKRLLEIRYLPNTDLMRITNFKTGQGIMLTAERYDVPLIVPPTRHKHASQKDDILQLLKDKHGLHTWDYQGIFSSISKRFKGDDDIVPEKEVSADADPGDMV